MTDFFLFISDTTEKQGEARGQRRGEVLSERRHHLSSPFSLPSCIRTFHRPGLPTQTQNWEMQKVVRRELDQRVQSSGWVASIWCYAAPSTDKDAAVEQKAKTKTSHSDADTGVNWSAGRPGDDTTIDRFLWSFVSSAQNLCLNWSSWCTGYLGAFIDTIYVDISDKTRNWTVFLPVFC